MDDIVTASGTDSSAPVSTPPTPSGETTAAVTDAPATPTPKPASFKEALAQVAARKAEPTGDAATTAPPAVAGADPAKKGPIPFDVHDTALKNAREKTRAEVIAELDQQYGWAKQVQPQEFQQIQALARHFAGGDVVAGIQSLLAEARKDPAVDAQLRSLHARALSAARGQSAPTDDQEPQPDLPIQLDNGQVVHLYSAAQQAKRDAYLQQRLLSQVNQQLQPVTTTLQTLKAEREAAVHAQQVEHFATTTHQDVLTWPGMSDAANQKAVAEALKAMRVDEHDPRAVTLAANEAWRRVVAPKLVQQGSTAQLASLKSKAIAQTESPSGAAAPAQPRPKNPQELAKFLAARASARRG